MGKAQRRRGNTSKNKQFQKIRRTRNKTKDIDQIIEDLKPENLVKLEVQPIDEDLPGLGQHYCIFCSRYFIDRHSLDAHVKSKEHKKRVKVTKELPYTIEDSKKYGGQMGK
jgi:bud site selection protein 20